MRSGDLVERRLRNQCLTTARHGRATEVVRWFGAVQAQEYDAAKWALGLRVRGATRDADVERAFDAGDILRTHVLRPTWHFVARADIRWLLDLTGPRVVRALLTYCRRVDIDRPMLVRAADVFARALRDNTYLTRRELADRLRARGIVAAGVRLAFLTIYAELEQIMCSGPRRGKQFTYALVSERAPDARPWTREEALAELVTRYFASHGPATVRDFVWWSGLTVADAKRGLEMTQARREEIDATTYWTCANGATPRALRASSPAVHLLPIYDEYLVAYRDRSAVPHDPAVLGVHGWAGTYQHTLVIGGQIAGVWKPSKTSAPVIRPSRRLNARERAALDAAVARYQAFRGR